jgi:hypothetical protein
MDRGATGVGGIPGAKGAEVMITRIAIEPTDIRGERGLHYRVHYAGEVLVEDTWSPEYDAARALLALGVTGRSRFEGGQGRLGHGRGAGCRADDRRERQRRAGGRSMEGLCRRLRSAASGRFGLPRCPPLEPANEDGPPVKSP